MYKLPRVTRRTALRSTGALLALGLGAGTAAGKPGSGQGKSTRADVVVEPTESIQAAIDQAADGDSILVKAGTYREELAIDKSLTLRGEGQPTIEAPDDLTTFGDDYHAVVRAIGDVSVTLRGFTIDARGVGSVGGLGGPNYSLTGVTFDGASGVIADSTVTGVRDTPLSGMQHGLAIFVINTMGVSDQSVTITNNYVEDFQKNGITVIGDCNTTITGNVVEGAGATAVIGQNGIQVSGAEHATVYDNTIRDFVYSPRGYSAAGILLNETANSDVKRNTLENVQTGVWLWDYTAEGGSGDGVRIMHNDFSGTWWGGLVYAVGGSLDNVKIVNNSFQGFDDGLGVYAAADGSIENTKLIHNDFDVTGENIVVYPSPDAMVEVKAHAN